MLCYVMWSYIMLWYVTVCLCNDNTSAIGKQYKNVTWGASGLWVLLLLLLLVSSLLLVILLLVSILVFVYVITLRYVMICLPAPPGSFAFARSLLRHLAILYYTMLCYTILYCTILLYTILRYTTGSLFVGSPLATLGAAHAKWPRTAGLCCARSYRISLRSEA